MTDELERTATAYRAAVAEETEAKAALAAAKQRRDDARKKVEDTRGPLAAAIVKEARQGRKQADIARISGYNRENVRRICRAAGIEPTD
ncbi:hypothetical protein [Polymorphospora rubra]|uniref:Uncharacterized protein n=1 Tax=Polymorphospora rubra TaxID=338584 RepID=A0A810MV99_9ACTN|nr:hypothetical protein [Polymorphospora rubra]BCJ65071.1 hypothetical protein Prubr_20920 [Polymorphospora rubra]